MELSADEQSKPTAPQSTRPAKRDFSGLSLKDAMRYTGQTDFLPWHIAAAPREPSAFLLEAFRRFEIFDLIGSEMAKLLLIDSLFTDIAPYFPRLRIWKGEALDSPLLSGIADYLVAPRRAYMETPILCAVEAKKDDFEQGAAQCVAEMVACRAINRDAGYTVDIHGIVSNGEGWQFYRLAQSGDVYKTELYTLLSLPPLLGALHHILAACDRNIPADFVPVNRSAFADSDAASSPRTS